MPVLNNILHHYFAMKFYNFAFLPVLEVDIVWITNYEYDKYFSMATYLKLGGTFDSKVRVKYHKNKEK